MPRLMSAPSPLLSPRDRRLDEIIALLSSRGDDRAIIQLVETWAISGSPTRKSKLHEARAFYNLRLMDRAMARTREVTETYPDDLEGQRLLAEIYLDRGWPSHARKLIAQLQASTPDPALEALSARAHAEPSRIASQAREIEAGGDTTQLLALAEHFLTTGSFFRARSILERLRRVTPDSRRVLDLVWALDGNFTSRDLNIEKLLEYIESRLAEQQARIQAAQPEVLPAPEADPDMDPDINPEQPTTVTSEVPVGATARVATDRPMPMVAPSESAGAQVMAGPSELAVRILTGPAAAGGDNSGDIPDEPEHTESARVNEMIPEESVSFPSLFKGDSRGARSSGKQATPLEEQTSVSKIARGEDLLGEETDPGIQGAPMSINPSGGDDTQIMLVLRPGEQAKPGWQQGKSLHKGAEPSRELNLREWQQSMGVNLADPRSGDARAEKSSNNLASRSAGQGTGQDLSPDLDRDYGRDGDENGDENVVLLQRQAPIAADPEPTGSRSRPIEVIEKVPLPIVTPPSAESVEVETSEPADDASQEGADEVGSEETPERSVNVIRLVVVVLALMFAALAAVIFAVFYFKLL